MVSSLKMWVICSTKGFRIKKMPFGVNYASIKPNDVIPAILKIITEVQDEPILEGA